MKIAASCAPIVHLLGEESKGMMVGDGGSDPRDKGSTWVPLLPLAQC